jgi:hypothetical protein
MELWEFLSMYHQISKDPCTEFLGVNPDTSEFTQHWPAQGWVATCAEHQILHTNHLFTVSPGNYLRYKHITISGEQFVAEVLLNTSIYLNFLNKFVMFLTGRHK